MRKENLTINGVLKLLSFSKIMSRGFIIAFMYFILIFPLTVWSVDSSEVQVDSDLRLGTAGTGIYFPNGTWQGSAGVTGVAPTSGLSITTGTGGATVDIDTTVIQKRVSASCTTGTAMTAIDSSGGATCSAMLPTCPTGQVLVQSSNGWQCGTLAIFNNAIGTCVQSSCTLMCPAGFADCDGIIANGCETNLSSASNCGSCGHNCSVPNAIAGCNNGTCTMQGCNSGYADCNNNLSDGCETYLLSDINNCGTCGNICPPIPHGTAGCHSGQCGIALCNAGYADCDGLSANGCEVFLTTDVANCGACGKACPAGVPCANSTCALFNQGAACTISAQCATGYCVHGFCSSSACTGICMSTVQSLTGQPNGTCANIFTGTDPYNQCSGKLCNGNGACNP